MLEKRTTVLGQGCQEDGVHGGGGAVLEESRGGGGRRGEDSAFRQGILEEVDDLNHHGHKPHSGAHCLAGQGKGKADWPAGY